MRLSADNIIEIIKNETLNLVENTIEELDDLEQLSKMLTVMNSETREKFTIQGSGDDVVTLQPASGEEPFDVTKEEFQKNYVLPKDAVDEDDQLHGDKEVEDSANEVFPNLRSIVKEAMFSKITEDIDTTNYFIEASDKNRNKRLLTSKKLNEISGIDCYTSDKETRCTLRPLSTQGAVVAVTGIASFAALNIVALNSSTAVGIAFFLSTSITPLLVGVGIVGLFMYLKKWVQKAYEKLDITKNVKSELEETIQELMNKVGLSRGEAITFLEYTAKAVSEDDACKLLKNKILKATNDNDTKEIIRLTDEFDAAQQDVILRLRDSLSGNVE